MKAIGSVALLWAILAATGCDSTPAGKDKSPSDKKAAAKSTEGSKKAHDHSGWWCSEHGIPESECLMCLHGPEDCKKKGDWCEKHEFAKSQCFKCDPSKRDFYAEKHRAKFGTEPPKADEN